MRKFIEKRIISPFMRKILDWKFKKFPFQVSWFNTDYIKERKIDTEILAEFDIKNHHFIIHK